MFRKFLGSIFMGMLLITNASAETTIAEPVIVEALRSQKTITDANQPVTIITREDIEKSHARSLQDLLNRYTSLNVTNYISSPKGVIVDSRGFGETSPLNILVLINGRRTNQIDLSGVDWAQINLEAVESIEVLKGANTVLYGDNAEAGVINIITRKSNVEPGARPSVRLTSEYGSYDGHKESVRVDASAERVDMAFTYVHQETEGYRVNDYYWANDYTADFTVYPSEEWTIDINTGYHQDRAGNPGALFATDIATLGREGSRAVTINDRSTASDGFVSVKPQVNFQIGLSDAELSILGSFRRRDTKAVTGTSSVFETAHSIQSFEIQPKLVIHTEVSESVDNTLTVGFDIFNADDDIRSGTLGGSPDFLDITKESYEFYVLENVVIDDKWFVDFGGRGSWAEYDFVQSAVLMTDESRSVSDGAFNAAVGYGYNPDSQVYFDFSRSYRLPTTEEFFTARYSFFGFMGGGLNTSLEHQTSLNYELGFRDNTFDPLKVSANFFLKDVTDEIYLDIATFNNTNYKPETRHVGLEVESRLSIFSDKLDIFTNWLIEDSEFRGGQYDGNTIPFVPRYSGSAGITIQPCTYWDATLNMNYVGKRFAISDQSNAQPQLDDYVTFDLTTSFQYKNAEIWFGVFNVLDEEYNTYGVYSSGANAVAFYPAAERNYRGGVDLKF